MTDSNGTTCSLYPNANKQHDQHPDLKGRFSYEGSSYDVSLWTRQTKDRTRIYHSVTIAHPYHKGETSNPPLAKGMKLYEFRKRKEDDPDFQTVEPFRLFEKDWALALWVEVANPDELESLKFALRLLPSAYAEQLTGECQETLSALRDRLLIRKKEEEEAAKVREEMEARHAEALKGDDISYDEHGDPDDLPF